MFLWETWVCPILGVPIPVLTANPQQYSYDNLISTLMVIIYKLVSINLQSYLHTNGSFTGTTFLLSTSGKVIQSLSYVIYGQYQDFTDFTFLSSFNILESQRYRLVKSRTHRYPTHCVSQQLPTWLDNNITFLRTRLSWTRTVLSIFRCVNLFLCLLCIHPSMIHICSHPESLVITEHNSLFHSTSPQSPHDRSS
jgi:hypothetical protein